MRQAIKRIGILAGAFGLLIRLRARVSRLILKWTGKYKFLKKGVQCEHVWYGTKDCGFYVNPQLLNEHSIVYSFGIGEDISFDLEVIKNHNCHIFGFDPTPKSINWIKSREIPGKFHFYPYGIGKQDGLSEFYLPKNTEHVSGSISLQKHVDEKNKVFVPMKSFRSIINELGHEHIDLLKIDIEGTEYDVIDDILAQNIRIDQVLIEFHDRLFDNGTIMTQNAIDKLKQNGFEIFAVSDSFLEVSFIHQRVRL